MAPFEFRPAGATGIPVPKRKESRMDDYTPSRLARAVAAGVLGGGLASLIFLLGLGVYKLFELVL